MAWRTETFGVAGDGGKSRIKSLRIDGDPMALDRMLQALSHEFSSRDE